MDIRELASAVALRARIQLEPVGGLDTTVFPPTYLEANSTKHVHAVETHPTADGATTHVLIDSVASQANRQEAALTAARRAGRIAFPDLRVDLSGTEDPRDELFVAELSHRIADATVRYCEIDGVAFAQSDYGRRILVSMPADLTPILEASPLSLIFGAWFSQWRMKQMLRLQRLSVSELWAHDATLGLAVSSRLDPLGIEKTTLYEDKHGHWTVDEAEAVLESGKPKPFGKGDGKGLSSHINHGNIAPGITRERGVRAARYDLTWVFSNGALRQLHFGGNAEIRAARGAAAEEYLLALALLGRVLAHEDGYALRSRCDLVPIGPFILELVPSPLVEENIVRHEVASADAMTLFEQAQEAAISAGFDLSGSPNDRPILVPSRQLVRLIARTAEQKLSLAHGEDG